MNRNLTVIAGGRAAGAEASSDVGTATRSLDLRTLYDTYGGSVYGRCYFLLKDRAKAEDAMQDVFAKVLINLTGFRSEASPLTWLTTIATNHCLNVLRSERAAWHQTFADRERTRAEVAQLSGPVSGPRLFEDREAVRKILERFDVETQAVAIHYYVDEMTLEEVATALGRSIPTVRKRLETFAAASGVEQES
jgi:RNA polymerase sigma-70 factor (ECF subfamily)